MRSKPNTSESNMTLPQCWICGAPANSREHRIKKSDLMRRYGRQSYRSMGGMVHVIGGEPHDIQGPSDSRLTYEPLLCADCNNAKSQPWDKAYEQFECRVFEHSREILRKRFILLEDVFGSENFSGACPNLYKYFVKAFGCRLVAANMMVPHDLVALLSQDHFLTKLRLAFAVNKTIFLMEAGERDNYLGLGELVRLDSRSRGRMEQYTWHMQIGWLRVSFFYDTEVPCGLGSAWTSDSACIYLGEFESASIEQLIEDARRRGNERFVARIEALRDRDGPEIE